MTMSNQDLLRRELEEGNRRSIVANNPQISIQDHDDIRNGIKGGLPFSGGLCDPFSHLFSFHRIEQDIAHQTQARDMVLGPVALTPVCRDTYATDHPPSDDRDAQRRPDTPLRERFPVDICLPRQILNGFHRDHFPFVDDFAENPGEERFRQIGLQRESRYPLGKDGVSDLPRGLVAG